MASSLLAHIAGNFISQFENVANSSIAYLLNSYPPARKALGGLVGRSEMPFRYVTELSAGSNGRPDVTGVNELGEKLIIIEGKFWANLTDNQPGNYLAELAPTGTLVFLAPERRRDSLLIELRKRCGLSKPDPRITVLSWIQYLDAIESENAKEPSFSLTSDLSQLRALCARMDTEGMPPLSLSDLDPMNGRITYQLADLLDDCRDLLREWGPIDLTRLKATAWKLGYGFYFRAYGLGCQLFFSTYQWYTTKAATPYWLTIKGEGFKTSEPILNTLTHWDPVNTYDIDAVANYAIHVPAGLDRQGVASHIVATVKAAIEVVASQVAKNVAET